MAGTFRAQLQNRCREGRKRVCALARLVGTERLEMELDIWGFQLGARFQERSAEACRHRHRPGAFQRIFQRNADILQRMPCLAVDCALRGLVNRPRLKMILQVLADAGQIVNHFDAMRGKLAASTNAGQHHDMRRSQRPGGQHHFTARRASITRSPWRTRIPAARRPSMIRPSVFAPVKI